MNYLLTVAYVGTNYCGWQVQPNAVSVQQTLQDAVEKVFGRRFPLTGCSRTDSGVHAKGFLCMITTDGSESSIPLSNVSTALNSLLPDDISVLSCEMADEDFHPRYGTFGKVYSYRYFDRRERDPFFAQRVWHIRGHLDENRMNEAAKLFVGEHDFSAFCASGTSDDNHVRTIYETDVRRIGDEVIFTVCGNGFLYNMVRIMAGTLSEVGTGRKEANAVEKALEKGDRTLAGITAPAYGLYLERVLREQPKQ